MHIQVDTRLTKEADAESVKKFEFFCKIALIVGIIGIVANVLISVICFPELEEDPFWLEIELYISAVIFALGLVLPITVKLISKKSQAYMNNVINHYEFFDDYMQTTSYRGEEKIAEAKNYYTEITKIRKTEHYIFLYLGLRGAYPIDIAAISQEEAAWLLTIKGKTAPPTQIEENVNKSEERND